jgi:hypothetical protein
MATSMGVWSGIHQPSLAPRLHLIHDERLLLAAWTAESLESRAGRAHAAESAMQLRRLFALHAFRARTLLLRQAAWHLPLPLPLPLH